MRGDPSFKVAPGGRSELQKLEETKNQKSSPFKSGSVETQSGLALRCERQESGENKNEKDNLLQLPAITRSHQKDQVEIVSPYQSHLVNAESKQLADQLSFRDELNEGRAQKQGKAMALPNRRPISIYDSEVSMDLPRQARLQSRLAHGSQEPVRDKVIVEMQPYRKVRCVYIYNAEPYTSGLSNENDFLIDQLMRKR